MLYLILFIFFIQSSSCQSSVVIKYAPEITPVTGNYNLYCVALEWSNHPSADLNEVSFSCEGVANTFKRISQGYFTFNPRTQKIAFGFDLTHNNVAHTVSLAKGRINGPKDKSSYVMVNNRAESVSHSHGDTSNLLNTLLTTFCHEVGRLEPYVLGSSGAYDTAGKYRPQGDGTSFMGNRASTEITLSQSYFTGWISYKQVAMFNYTSDGTKEFNLTSLDDYNDTVSLKGVLMLGVDKKPLFLSRPTFKDQGVKYALHLASGGDQRGSERIAVFDQSYTYRSVEFVQVNTLSSNSIITTVRLRGTNNSSSFV
jgi:hypothetical protein